MTLFDSPRWLQHSPKQYSFRCFDKNVNKQLYRQGAVKLLVEFYQFKN